MGFLSTFQLLLWKKMQYLCKLPALLCVYDYNIHLYRTAEPFLSCVFER